MNFSTRGQTRDQHKKDLYFVREGNKILTHKNKKIGKLIYSQESKYALQHKRLLIWKRYHDLI